MDVEPINPRDILYRAIDRFLSAPDTESRALGGLCALVATLEDDTYREEMDRIKTESRDVSLETFAAILSLLHRKNLWLRPPRGIVEGEELIEAID